MLVYNVNFQIMFSFFVKSRVSHWKHLQDIIELPCLFLMWTFTSYFQFDMKSHVSQLKFELSDHIPFVKSPVTTLEALEKYFGYKV